MAKYKLIALMGKAGSGKDTVMKAILKESPVLNEVVSCTTRPRRDYEVDGKDYHFYSVEKFTSELIKGKLLEAAEFNGWFYGTPIESLDKDRINIAVLNPSGIKACMNNKDIDLKIFYIQASDKTRLIRQLKREEEPNVEEILRRYNTDKNDFLNAAELYNPYCILNDNGYTPAMSAKKLLEYCSEWLGEKK